jgi:hypothetical protein
MSSKFAGDLKDFVKVAIKKLEERRKFYVGPMNDHIKTINKEFATWSYPLETMLETLKTKIGDYIVLQRERDRIAAEEKQKALDKLSKEKNLPKVEVQVEERRTIVSSQGKTFTRKDWAWKVVDLNKIPREFFTLDEKLINAQVKAGIRTEKGVSSNVCNIEGIAVYQKETVI